MQASRLTAQPRAILFDNRIWSNHARKQPPPESDPDYVSSAVLTTHSDFELRIQPHGLLRLLNLRTFKLRLLCMATEARLGERDWDSYQITDSQRCNVSPARGSGMAWICMWRLQLGQWNWMERCEQRLIRAQREPESIDGEDSHKWMVPLLRFPRSHAPYPFLSHPRPYSDDNSCESLHFMVSSSLSLSFFLRQSFSALQWIYWTAIFWLLEINPLLRVSAPVPQIGLDSYSMVVMELLGMARVITFFRWTWRWSSFYFILFYLNRPATVTTGVALLIICYLSDKETLTKTTLSLQFERYMNSDPVFCKCKAKSMNPHPHRKDGFGTHQILRLLSPVASRWGNRNAIMHFPAERFACFAASQSWVWVSSLYWALFSCL